MTDPCRAIRLAGGLDRRGFAMLTAIALVALVSVAMAAAAAVFRLDVRRTASAAEEAELRELLMAGERIARERLASAGGDDPRAGMEAVPLPPSLAADGGSLRLIVTPGPASGTMQVIVEAAVPGRSMSQALRYERGPNGWGLGGAGLISLGVQDARGDETGSLKP